MRPCARTHRRMREKRGLTLVELIVVSAILVMVIGATSYALSSVLAAFRGASSDMTGYQQAVTLETMLKTEASYAESVSVTSTVPAGNRSSFGFEETTSGGKAFHIKAAQRGEGTTESATSRASVNLDAITELKVDIVTIGTRSRLDYRITAVDDQTHYVLDGGIVLNNILTVESSNTLTPGTAKWLAFKPTTAVP